MSAALRPVPPATSRPRLALRRRKAFRRAIGVVRFAAWAGGPALLAAVALAGLLTIR